eukprot:1145581-Pelagomonas_calceolata.AAC.3
MGEKEAELEALSDLLTQLAQAQQNEAATRGALQQALERKQIWALSCRQALGVQERPQLSNAAKARIACLKGLAAITTKRR